MENKLGAHLLERTTRSLSLTEIGREFFELAVGILPSVEDTERAVQAGQLRGVLTDWSLPTVPVHAVFANARYLTPKVRAFIDLAVEAMRTAHRVQTNADIHRARSGKQTTHPSKL